jgi:hypothetical protein
MAFVRPLKFLKILNDLQDILHSINRERAYCFGAELSLSAFLISQLPSAASIAPTITPQTNSLFKIE